MESIGLKALKIFRANASLSSRKKYPKIYHEVNTTNIDYDRNKCYLYYPLNDEAYAANSPWYAFKLIDTSLVKDRLLDVTFDLLNFINWAIYYHKVLCEDYDSIPKNPKKQQVKTSMKWEKYYAKMLNIELTEEETKAIEKNIYKKNNFILKPSKFLKICRLFARGWYEEHIETVGSVKFAHYITNYIVNKDVESPICPLYNAHNENLKKEVSRLFKTNKYEYQYKEFHIELNKHITNGDKVTYTVSIMHYKAIETFYLFSRLYQSNYQSSIKG